MAAFNLGVLASAGSGAAAAPVAHTIPTTIADKLGAAKAARDDHAARFAALRAAGATTRRGIRFEPIIMPTTIEFKVVEEATETLVSDLLAAWRGPIDLTPIDDVFNDKLDYRVDTWAKLEALNDGMLRVMTMYQMLYPESPDVIAATSAFVTNYRVVGEALASMEARVRGGGGSTVAEMEAEAADITAWIAAWAARHGARLTAPAPPLPSPPVTPAAAAAAASAPPMPAVGGAAARPAPAAAAAATGFGPPKPAAGKPALPFGLPATLPGLNVAQALGSTAVAAPRPKRSLVNLFRDSDDEDWG